MHYRIHKNKLQYIPVSVPKNFTSYKHITILSPFEFDFHIDLKTKKVKRRNGSRSKLLYLSNLRMTKMRKVKMMTEICRKMKSKKSVSTISFSPHFVSVASFDFYHISDGNITSCCIRKKNRKPKRPVS